MAEIKYTSIINSFVSQEGSMGTYTNYVYYSILVVYSNGTKEIVEGKRSEIFPLLLYLRTPIDELQDIKELMTTFPSEIGSIRKMIDDRINYVIDSLYPIPDVRGMKQEDAIRRLEEYGLIPNIIQSEESPDSKQDVSSLQRNKLNFKYVDIGTAPSIPAIDGLTKDIAVEILEKAGFQVEVKYVPSQDHEQDIVLGCCRSGNSEHLVELKVGGINPLFNISTSINDSTDIKKVLDGLKYASTLGMESVIRRKLKSLYAQTDSALIKKILDVPDSELKRTCQEAIEILEEQPKHIEFNKCQYCGKENLKSVRFCSNCGEKLQ